MTSEPLKQTLDAAAYAGVVGTILGWLPHIAAALSIVWLLIQISQSQRFAQFVAWIRQKGGNDGVES